MINKTELILKWIEKADHDLGTAILIFKHIPEYRDTIAFHCQQAVEKYLKGYLLFLDLEFRKIHDLVYLAELIGQKKPLNSDLISKLIELEDYAVEIRYPDSEIQLTNEEILNAIAISKEIREYITNSINIQNSNKK